MTSRKERPRKRPRPAAETCPQCGTSFRAGRLACPECGSDAETGWRSAEDIDYLALDLPEEPRELPDPRARPAALGGRLTGPVLVLLVVVMVVCFCLRML